MTLWSPLCLAQVLFLLGTLIFAMSLQLDRRGAWNMMGPCLFAFVVMVTMWVRSWEASAPALTPPLVVGIRESGLPADPDSGTRAWPVILAMFLLLGLSPARLSRTAGGTREGPTRLPARGPGLTSVRSLCPWALSKQSHRRSHCPDLRGPWELWLQPAVPTLTGWFSPGVPLRAPAPLLPHLLAALGLLPPARHLNGCCGHCHLYLHDDQ